MDKKKNKNIKHKTIFSFKSPLFIFSILFVVAIFFMFFCWVGVKASLKPKTLFGTTSLQKHSSQGKVIYEENEGSIPCIYKVDNNGNKLDDFKILTTTDFHFHPFGNDLTLTVFSRFLDKEKPDLVVLDGDIIFMTTNTSGVNKMVKMFEQKQIYWTFAIGNHDSQGWERKMGFWQAKEKAFDAITGKNLYGHIADHCLARSNLGFGKNVGCGTSCLNILGSNNKIMHTLFLYDSHSLKQGNETLINWTRDTLIDIKNKNNNVLPEIFVFCHEPLVELENGIKSLNTNKATYYYGVTQESCHLNNGKKSGIVETFKQQQTGNDLTFIFGHDHINNISIRYEDVNYMYSLALPYNSYNSRFIHPISWINNIAYALDNSLVKYIDGVSTFYIEKDMHSSVNLKYSQFEHVLDGLEGKLYVKTGLSFTYNAYPFSIFLYLIMPLTLGACITYFVFFGIKRKKKVNK